MKTTHRNKKTLAEQTADQLKEMIINGGIENGSQLPSEFQLAEQLDVGRGTIREAVKILASKRIVEIRRGYGTFVAENPGKAEDPLGLEFIRNKKKLTVDLYEMRLLIEPQIAALAAQRATEDGLERIIQASRAIEDNIAAGQPWTEEDIAFHERIAEASQNQLASNIVPIIHSAVKVFAQLYGKPLKGTTVESHQEIIEAIASHDAEKARETMTRHLMRNKEYIESLMGEKDSERPTE